MSFYLKLNGLKKFMEMLDRMPEKLEEIEKEVLQEGAEMVKKDAKSNLTISGRGLALKDNIQISDIIKKENGNLIILVGIFWNDNIPGTTNQTELYYAPFHHWGTSSYSGNPFLLSASNKNKRKIIKLVKEKINNVFTGD